MAIRELKKSWKNDLIDILISFVITSLIYLFLNSRDTVGVWFLPVMFLLILIYLKIPERK